MCVSRVQSLHKGYKCFDVSAGRVYISHDVVFDEENFSFSHLSPSAGHHLSSTPIILDDQLIHKHVVSLPSNIFVPLVDDQPSTDVLMHLLEEDLSATEFQPAALPFHPAATPAATASATPNAVDLRILSIQCL